MGMRQIAPRFSDEYGWAAWVYSKTAKLNAWSWHGLGATSLANIDSWATLGTSIYMRREGLTSLYVMQPDTFIGELEANSESPNVYAETQWLDFGKPGILKSLTGIDFDGQNVIRVEVYVAIGGSRIGELADIAEVGSSQGGWTYSTEVIPVTASGTEFKLRFVGDPDAEVQVNRVTCNFDDLGAN